MESLDILAKESLVRYFNLLEKVGSTPNNEVYRVLILAYLWYFLDEFSDFITLDDKETIICFISNLSIQSCVIKDLDNISFLDPIKVESLVNL